MSLAVVFAYGVGKDGLEDQDLVNLEDGFLFS